MNFGSAGSSTSDRPVERAHLTRLLLLLAAVALVYWNTLDNSFHFDDQHSLTENPHIRDLRNIPDFFARADMFSRNAGSGMYRPLVLVSYALNYRLDGYAVRGYHAVNLVLHILVTWLVYGLLVRLGTGGNASAVAAVLFGIHPLTTEPVNYISSRSESMAALFVLLSFFVYARSSSTRPSALSVASYAGALLSKSVAVFLPLALILYELSEGGGRWRRRIWRRQWPFWLVSLAYLVGSSALIGEAMVQERVRSWSAQMATQCKAVTYYLKSLVLPEPLSVEPAFTESGSLLETTVVLSIALLVSLGFLAWRSLKHGWRVTWLWLTWMGLAAAPTLLVPLNMLVNERRLYLVLIGFLGVMSQLLRDSARIRLPLLAAGVAFVFLTVQRNSVWATELTLWRDAAQKAPGAVRPHIRLGVVYRAQGKLDWARSEYEKALALDPLSAAAMNNLGNLHSDQDRADEAERSYRAALEILPNYPDALVNLAALYSKQARFGEALALYERAMPLGPSRAELFNGLGTTYLRMGRYKEAEAELRRALALSGNEARILFNLGGALEGQGLLSEAVTAYSRAVELDPTYAKPYYNVAVLYERLDRPAEARTAYESFLRRWRGEAPIADQARRRLVQLGR